MGASGQDECNIGRGGAWQEPQEGTARAEAVDHPASSRRQQQAPCGERRQHEAGRSKRAGGLPREEDEADRDHRPGDSDRQRRDDDGECAAGPNEVPVNANWKSAPHARELLAQQPILHDVHTVAPFDVAFPLHRLARKAQPLREVL
jgi:hypothetical protein